MKINECMQTAKPTDHLACRLSITSSGFASRLLFLAYASWVTLFGLCFLSYASWLRKKTSSVEELCSSLNW